MDSRRQASGAATDMPETLVFILFMIAAVIVYVVAQVLFYMRRSDEQWKEVDKSKLKEWEDEDEW